MKSTSLFCIIDRYELFVYGNEETQEGIIPYGGNKFTLDSSQNIHVNLEATLNQTVIIRAFTIGDVFNDLKILIEIWHCSEKSISQNRNPIGGLPEFTEVISSSGRPAYLITAETNNTYLQLYATNVKPMFVSSHYRCPPVSFYIDEYSGRLPFKRDILEDYLGLNVEGEFTFYNFKQPIDDLQVYIRACNRAKMCSPV